MGYQVFCQVHRRFIFQSWAVGIIPTHLFAPILHRQRLRFVTKTVTKPGFLLAIAEGTRTLFGYTLHGIAGRICSGCPQEGSRYSALSPLRDLSECSHKETWAGSADSLMEIPCLGPEDAARVDNATFPKRTIYIQMQDVFLIVVDHSGCDNWLTPLPRGLGSKSLECQ